MLRTVALIGAPGSGKTSLMRKIIPLLGDPGAELSNNIAPDGHHLNYARCTTYPTAKLFLFGLYTGSPYDGTDRLGRNVLPAAIVILQKLAASPPLDGWTILLEGDRLASRAFLDEAWKYGPVIVPYLVVDDAELARRRSDRTAANDAEWLKTAVPKVAGKPRRAGRINGQDANWSKGRATKAYNIYARYSGIALPNNNLQDQHAAFVALCRLLNLGIGEE